MPLRLSEAIRLGAMLKPQGSGADSIRYRHVTATCALGAACEAVGAEYREAGADLYGAVSARWPWVTRALEALPNGDPWPMYYTHRSVADAIYTLNDHGWTREQIADWVETLEAQHEPLADPVADPQPVTV